MRNYALLFGLVTSSNSKQVVDYILRQNIVKNKPKTLYILIDSRGGELSHAYSIIKAINMSNIPVCTYVLGEAASAALMILMAGTKGYRFASPDSSFMSHRFVWDTNPTQDNFKNYKVESSNAYDKMFKHYQKYTTISKTRLKKDFLLKDEFYFTADEAVEYGIVDDIKTTDKISETEISFAK